MKAIEKRVEEETDQAMKAIENQIDGEAKEKIQQHKKYITRLEKQYEKKLEELRTEKDKILEDMIKLQTEYDLTREKVDSVEKKEKMKRNLELFNSLVNADDHKQQKDECINSVACDGDCDNVNELRRLNSLKKLGSSRVCPQTKPQDKPLLKCDMCDFISQNKDYMSIHIKKHEEEKNCKQCC